MFTKKIEISRGLYKTLQKAWRNNIQQNGLVSWNNTFERYCEYMLSRSLVYPAREETLQ